MSTVLQTPLNDAQVEILQLFSEGLTNEQLQELRDLLIEFRFRLLDEQILKVAEEKNLTYSKIEKLSKEHHRTTYKSKNIKNQE